ncbi:uncharacterized protein [Rutidosis leptorrhynchoides]|uniref:uncharacterized protein n=1 Tax=Rutidosis leptorrhynchoides TaxID=125765 RepID=UPI003A9A4953
MACFLLKISSPSILTSKTNILPPQQLTHKPFYFTANLSKKPQKLAITNRYQTPTSISNAVKDDISNMEVEYLALCNIVRAGPIPKHVALLMDSHKNTEKRRGFHTINDHSLIDIAQSCCELGIKVLSVYTLPEKLSVGSGFALNILKLDSNELSRNDIKVSVIGNRNSIPNSLQEIITKVEETTKNNKSLHIIEAVNYSGRLDMVQACKALAEKVYGGLMEPIQIDENVFQQELETKCLDFPNPDLMIRTGGKYSVDDFMLWQSAYAEICFVEKNGVQFDKIDFIEALHVYQKRNRRFGGSKKVV